MFAILKFDLNKSVIEAKLHAESGVVYTPKISGWKAYYGIELFDKIGAEMVHKDRKSGRVLQKSQVWSCKRFKHNLTVFTDCD